jgi:pilus assembly protein CpaE
LKESARKRDEGMEVLEKTKANREGKLIVVCSAKGGVGKTILSVNLAVCLAKKNKKVTVIDGDFQFGDVNLAMDLHDTFSIKDVVEDVDKMDEIKLAPFLAKHQSGVHVLAAPARPEYADMITDESLEKTIRLLLAMNEYVIVDTGVGFYENSLNFLEKADKLLVVTNLEMATIKNTKRMLETIEMLGYKEKVEIVINRSTMESVLTTDNVIDILNVEHPYLIPNDFKVVSQSFNMGTPLVLSKTNNPVAKSLFKMALQLSSNSKPLVPKQKKRFFQFL